MYFKAMLLQSHKYYNLLENCSFINMNNVFANFAFGVLKFSHSCKIL
jgi:hypothetical protein